MKKVLKTVGIVVGVLIAFVLALALTLPLWIGPVVTAVANRVVPGVTGTAFTLGEFGLNPYAGRLHAGQARLENPSAYSERRAVTVGSLDVSFDTGSLLSDTIVIRDATIREVFVSYVFDTDGTANFTVIGANAEKAMADPMADPARVAAAPAEPAASKKVIIDRLRLEDIVVKVGLLPVPIKSLTLTNIGRETDGVNWATAGEEIWKQIQEKTGLLSGDLGLDKALDAVQKLDVKGAEKAIRDVGGQIRGLFK